MRLTDLQNDKRSLRVGHAPEPGIITSAYLKLTAKAGCCIDRYLYLLLHSYDTIKVFYGMGGGLRQSMKFDDMRRLLMLIPSMEEQEQIANFLDHETAKIDTLIDKQQQLIKLLKEKRQAVISHAVTKGLNPDAPMKDSGVEWLGEVPEHWGVGRVKHQAAQPNLSMENLGNIIIPIPPEKEVVKIVAKLEVAQDKHQRLSDLAEAKIKLLQERRTALISAAVTGKIDVRKWKPESVDICKEKIYG